MKNAKTFEIITHKKNNIKKETGAITIIVLVTVLFVVSFLVSTYALISNKVQAQKEIISKTKDIYEPKETMEEIYNSYFNTENVIPVYTTEQLLAMGTNATFNIDGKIFTFTNDSSATYLLMNDIEFNAYDIDANYYWDPIGSRNDIQYSFEGNGNKIKVHYLDNQDDEYFVEYSKANSFNEPEYEINVAITLNNVVKEEAQIFVNGNMLDTLGEATTKIKRLDSVELSTNLTNDTRTIRIDNPNKIESVYAIDLNAYSFKVNITPSDTNVTINEKTGNTYSAYEGEAITWTANRNYYYSQSGSYTMGNSAYQENITLAEKPSVTLTLNPSSVSSSGSFATNANNANKGVDADTGTYARATGNSYLQWNFTGFSDIDNNARIDSITAYFRVAAAWSMGALVEIKTNTVTCLNKSYDKVYTNLVAGSEKYTDIATSLPTAADLKNGIAIKVTKGSTSSSTHFRWYGATIAVAYTNP